jgi:hypothetical protein
MMSGLLLLAVCGALSILVARTLGRRGPLSAAAIAIAAAAPAVLVFGCIGLADLQGRIGELRLSLDSIEVAPGGRPISIGGDADNDDFVATGLVKRAAVLTPGEPARLEGRLSPTPQERARGEAPVVVSTGVGPDRRFLGALPIESGDALCLSRCDGRDARWYQFDAVTARFWPAEVADGGIRRLKTDPADAGPAMPQRKALKLVSGLSWSPDQAVFPLRNHLPAKDGAQGGEDCGRVWYCAAAASPVTSFLFQKGGLQRDWQVLLLDPGARLAHAAGGGVTFTDAKPTAHGALGADIDRESIVTVWEARFSDVEPLDSGAYGRLVERRSLHVAPTRDGGLQLHFDQDPVAVLGVCNESRRSFAKLVANGQPPVGDVTGFSELGGELAQALSGPIGASAVAPCATLQRVRFDLARAGFAKGRFELDWFGGVALLWIIVAGFAALSFTAQRRLWRERRVAFALLAVVQLFLALRLLFGVAGVAADPSLDWRAIVASAMLAYVAVPSLALLWGPASPERRRTAIQLALYLAAVLAALWLWLGQAALLDRSDRFSLALAALVFAAAAVRLFGLPAASLAAQGVEALRRRPWTRWAAVAVVGATLAAGAAWMSLANGSPLPIVAVAVLVVLAGAGAVLWRVARRRLEWSDPVPSWALVLFGAAGLRFALGVLGVKERVLGVAVSALYTPALVIGFALLFAELLKAVREDRPNRAWRMAVYAGSAVLIAVAGVSFAVSDSGYALIVAPVLFGAGAWWGLGLARAKGGLWRLSRAAWGAPAALLVAGWLFLLVVAPRLDAFEDFNTILHANGDAQSQLVLNTLDRHLQVDNNMTRLYALARPSTLASTGTATAENQRAWEVQINDYTAPLFGRGWMTPPHLTTLLRPVQLSDNSSAIHLMSPFGRLATAAVLLLLGLLAAGCARATLPAGGAAQRSFSEVAGILSLWLVFGAAAYMILGNLQIVPFTGRNVYFLAPTSESDLLEALALFAIAFWGLGRQESR